MSGRRVTRSGGTHNPLYALFLCLIAAVLVLVIVVVVLSSKLTTAQKQVDTLNADLQTARQQVELLRTKTSDSSASETKKEETPTQEQTPDKKEETKPTQEQTTPAKKEETKPAREDVVGWLNLTGHSEVAVTPKTLFDKYYTYYATTGVNLRGGPGTDYERIKLVESGTQVKAAAKEGDWTFVSAGDYFGWISSQYLSNTPPAAPVTTTPVQLPEATDGNLKTAN